ncbi:uncharacterized protein ACN2A1_003376 [Glossina fuscipes fuscipes]
METPDNPTTSGCKRWEIRAVLLKVLIGGQISFVSAEHLAWMCQHLLLAFQNVIQKCRNEILQTCFGTDDHTHSSPHSITFSLLEN